MARSFRPLVVCYHAVTDAWPHPLAVGKSLLERQLRTLAGYGYRPARAEDILAAQGRLLHVTFDDGYKSVAEALPVLERLGAPCTIFVCAAYADDGSCPDFPELRDQAEAYPEELATLSWAELAGLLANDRVEVGSHTLSHPHLTELSDAELSHELVASRRRIEDELGRPCRYLAYPFGEEDGRVRAAARRAGYDAAFTIPGRRRPVDLYGLPRVGLYPHDGRLRTTLKVSPPGRQLSVRRLRRKQKQR